MADTLVDLPLYDAITACRECAIRAEAKRPLPPEGPLDTTALIIGQNPGHDEERAGRIFIGNAGEELNGWLRVLRVDRKKIAIANIVHCFPGDVRMQAAGVVKAYRRWYSGEIVTLKTAAGNDLTGTPNHPVLTSRGWMPLGALHEGDHLISGTFRQRVGGGHPDVDHGPARAEELFETLAELGVRKRIADADVQFHGDAISAEIDVVATEGLLRHGRQPALGEQRLQVPFVAADVFERGRSPLSTILGYLLDQLRGLGSTRDRTVGGFDHALPRTLPEFSPATAVIGRVELPTFSRDVSRFANLHARAGEDAADTPDVGGACARGESHQTAPLLVGADQVCITGVERRTWSGHVYNLETTSGEYTANGYIVHNCHTTKNRAPRVGETRFCAQKWLPPLLAALPNLQVILPLGRPAQSVVLPKLTVPLLEMQTARVEYSGRQFQVYPLVHPAYILRTPGERPRQQSVLVQVRDHWARELAGAYDAVRF